MKKRTFDLDLNLVDTLSNNGTMDSGIHAPDALPPQDTSGTSGTQTIISGSPASRFLTNPALNTLTNANDMNATITDPSKTVVPQVTPPIVPPVVINGGGGGGGSQEQPAATAPKKSKTWLIVGIVAAVGVIGYFVFVKK